MKLRVFLATLTAACASSGSTPTPEPEPAGPPAAAAVPSAPYLAPITGDEIRADLMVFASDSFRGREAGTPDAVRAARWLAGRLAAIGVEPAGDSGFFQRVPLMRERFTPQSSVEVRGGTGAGRVALGTEILPILDGPPLTRATLLRREAPLVFASYGRPTDFANISADGRAVVIVNGAPRNSDAATKARMESDSAISPRIQRAAQAGAPIIIILLTGASEHVYDQLASEMASPITLEGAPSPPAPARSGQEPLLFVARLRPGSPLLPQGWPANESSMAIPGAQFVAQVQMQSERFFGYNVVGKIRGTDPTMNNSYFAYGAHLDHIGIQPAVGGDSIANGADDDGSGSTTLLAVARALVAKPARRSALFVWHTAEEKGLFGSEHFTQHPTVPIDSIVSQFNADMIGRNAPDSLYIIGPLSAPNGQSRVLGRIVDSVNVSSPTPFSINREWDSPNHPEHLYERSDHYNYARRGIPVVFFTTGLHPEYHEVSDEISKINFQKLAGIGNLLFNAGQAVGNRSTRPK